MNITVIQKPSPHCPIPYGHPLYKGYVPVDHTDIRQTWARASQIRDDYENVLALDWLSAPGGFR